MEASAGDLTVPAHRVGLALSGGGFRAAAFHLGVLKRLEELEVLPHITLMSTVSGGSITGALYALRCVQHGDGRPGVYPVDELIKEIRELVITNLRRSAFFGTPLRAARTGLSFLIRPVRRMPLLIDELDRRLFSRAPLSALPPWILINATNLSTGKGWKFFRDRAGDYLIGATARTERIRVAEAVGASAAYPVLVDPYPFHARWEELRADLLDERWARPPTARPGDVSRWRRRYGRAQGNVILPLVDGGLYDNEGLNGLRSARADYAIVASTASPEDEYTSGREPGDLLRMVDVMHSRLGAVTRQHAHEMTHGRHPSDTRRELLNVANELRGIHSVSSDEPGKLDRLAERLVRLSEVGWPPRGHQYKAIAPILLHRTDIAQNKPSSYERPYDIPVEDRGLTASLVEELSRVRTDLDAYSGDVVDLLIAQGYFLTDAHLKINMADLIRSATGTQDPLGGIRPSWMWAHDVIARANANERTSAALLEQAARRKLLLGHSPKPPRG